MNSNEIGLTVLTWIKKRMGNEVQVDQVYVDHAPAINHQKWTSLLQKYVTEEGRVNYKGFLTDSLNLDIYLNELSQNPPGRNWSDSEKLAYWINAYNAFTVKLILDYYPIGSIKDISKGLPMINSPWDIKFFRIGDLAMDLNTIEHSILRKEFDEPRIHFAINCASFSCPRLGAVAYESATLEKQLEDQAHYFINNVDKNTITQDLTQVSKIFNWFAGDFTREGSVRDYIHKYNSDVGADITYMDYDWTLNE